MSPIACLFLDGAHREPARTVAVVRQVHDRRVDAQTVAVSSIVRCGRPIVNAQRDIGQLTTAVVAVAQGRDEERLVTRRVSRAELTTRRLFARGTYPVPVYIGCTTLTITIRRETRERVTVRELEAAGGTGRRYSGLSANPIACYLIQFYHLVGVLGDGFPVGDEKDGLLSVVKAVQVL